MKQAFWLIPGRLAGRAGPAARPWDLGAMKDAGVTAIVSTDADCQAALVTEAGLKHVPKFMPTVYPTNDALIDRFVDLVRDAAEAVVEEVRKGGCVLVHCYVGRDRTGLVLSAALMELERLSAVAALAKVKAVRPEALTGPGVIDVLKQYERVYGAVDVSRP